MSDSDSAGRAGSTTLGAAIEAGPPSHRGTTQNSAVQVQRQTLAGTQPPSGSALLLVM